MLQRSVTVGQPTDWNHPVVDRTSNAVVSWVALDLGIFSGCLLLIQWVYGLWSSQVGAAFGEQQARWNYPGDDIRRSRASVSSYFLGYMFVEGGSTNSMT
jgi:hypothetical protein